jgi:hypothetical protein
MANVIPSSALPVLNKTVDALRFRANADGEIFGGEIMDVMQESASSLGVARLEVLLIRTVLVRAMESLGEYYPAEVLQNFESRMRVSYAIKYLQGAIAVASQEKAAV